MWSPDGTKIAFSDNRETGFSPDGDVEVFIIGLDVVDLRQFTHDDSHDRVVSWR